MGLLIAFVSLRVLPKLILHSIWAMILVAGAAFYLFQPTAVVDTQHAKLREQFCVYVYRVTTDKIPVCSTEHLTKSQVRIIERRLAKSLALYPDFASKYGELKYRIPITIYVMDVETLNDQSIFGSKFKKRVVGRYSEGLGHVYVTTEMFDRVGYTDLQHELAHYGNDNLGLSGDDSLDEKLANKFERYYRRHVY